MRFIIPGDEDLKRYIMFLTVFLSILTCVSIALFPITLERNLLPKDNFVTLTKSVIIEPDNLSDSGYESILDSLSELEIFRSQASGLTFRSVNGKSYILTADHFCDIGSSQIPSLGISKNTYEKITASDLSGDIWDTQVVFYNALSDLCLLESNMEIQKEIPLATKYPKMGDTVYAVAAPRGVSSEGVALHFEGTFSGCDTNDMCFFTLPATFGSSGGIVLNHNNEIVGMIQMTVGGIDNVSLGVGVSTIKGFLLDAEEELGVSLVKHPSIFP